MTQISDIGKEIINTLDTIPELNRDPNLQNMNHIMSLLIKHMEPIMGKLSFVVFLPYLILPGICFRRHFILQWYHWYTLEGSVDQLVQINTFKHGLKHCFSMKIQRWESVTVILIKMHLIPLAVLNFVQFWVRRNGIWNSI